LLSLYSNAFEDMNMKCLLNNSNFAIIYEYMAYDIECYVVGFILLLEVRSK